MKGAPMFPVLMDLILGLGVENFRVRGVNVFLVEKERSLERSVGGMVRPQMSPKARELMLKRREVLEMVIRILVNW